MKIESRTLVMHLVKDHTEALAVAMIRNECRHWMTNDTSALDVARQYEFFDKIRNDSKLWLFIAFLEGVPCGYGVLKLHRNKACLTGGLATPFRGRGIGKQLFSMLRCAACDMGRKPWLTVLRSNERAVRLYIKLGFHITKATKDIYTMEYRP